MNINAIVFARYNSSRLPGKVLYKLESKTILGYCIDKLKDIPSIKIVVATSREESDSPIIEWCIMNNVDYFRGDLKNVASRTYDCLLQKPCDAFFRINADSPFLQPSILLEAIRYIKSNPEADIVTNIAERTYPYGIAVELISTAIFKRYYHQFESSDNEHITQFFYRNSSMFRIKNICNNMDLSKERWVLDTPEDWIKIKHLYATYGNIFSFNIEQLHKLIKNTSKTY